MSAKRFIEKSSAFKLFAPALPCDHSRQVTAEYSAWQGLSALGDVTTVLDLGCGNGDSIALFQRLGCNATWHGVDIEDSPEVHARTRRHANMTSYDGVRLPYEPASFDLVYSRQVFEHVRHPDALLADVCRVLKPGGVFVGSVAYLEPYHSRSIFNFTPFGLMTCCQDAGLEIVEMRPGVDGLTLMVRQMLNRPNFFRHFMKRSPANLMIGGLGRLLGLNHQHINFVKLQLTGHICFFARRPA